MTQLSACLDTGRLNQAVTRPIHRGSTLNDIIPRLATVHYMIINESSSGYHNLKLDKKSPSLTMSACQFGGYRFTRLLFGVRPAGDMFQQKIDKIFKDPITVFGIADDILIFWLSC